MARGERVRISLFENAASSGRVLPSAASTPPEKLSTFCGVGDGGGGSNGETGLQRKTGIKATVVNAKDVVTPSTMRKRGALVNGSGAVATEKTVPSPSPSHCRPKKVTTLSPTAHGRTKALHHRGSPSLYIVGAAEISPSPTPARRTLRQSLSFSGSLASTPRPGARSAQPSPAPRAGASNSARHRSSISRQVEDDATLCQDHNVQVVIRARPVNGAEIALQGRFARCVRQENARTLSWLGKPEARFTFDHVAGEFVTQGELFRVAGLPMVDNCMAGYNSCMFAYGQTGSGKTHTMLGDIEDFEGRGMAPRVFEYLFAMIRKEEEVHKQGKLQYTCRCSFLEIYNEQISDLLEPSSANLQIREDVKKGVFVEGLLEVEVQNVEDVLHLLLLGATNRKVATTNMNRESSRSHSVFTCVIESRWECDSVINFRFGRLNLVDLAGSERQKDTGADGERLREAASINKSLSALGHVIMVLVDIANGKQRHVPYRDCKLTFLLQDSLGGNSKTTIIANISPSSCASSETLSTLKFAQRAKFIQNNAVINENFSSGDVKEIQEKIDQLKDELARIRRRQSVSRTSSLSVKKDANVSPAERQRALEHLRNEVESHQRSLLDCRMKLRNSMESNERISRELDALRLELQSSQEECRKYKQDLATFQQLKKTLAINFLEFKQPQHQNVVLDLKTLLQKSEGKAEQETTWRNQIELRLHKALHESSNLQTQLQWTRDSVLEGSEAAVDTFQRSEPVLGIGDPDTSYVAFLVEQLQAKIIQLHAMLEDERRHRRELEDGQIKLKYGTTMSQDFAYNLPNGYRKHGTRSTENPCHGKERRKFKHQEAILQLQMELSSLEGCAPDAMKCSKWEEVLAATNMTALNGVLTESKVFKFDHLQQQLEDLTQSNPSAEKALSAADPLPESPRKGNEGDLKPTTTVAEAECQRCIDAEAARLKLEEELEKHLEATRDLQHQVKMKEKEIVNLERRRDQLQEEVKRKQCAIEAVEEHLLKSEQSKLQCQEELLHLNYEHKAEMNKTRAQETQVEVEILRKSVEELENTVYALESQVGLLKREGERQCLVRQDMEIELQGLKQQNLEAAQVSQRFSARGDELDRTERMLKEREAEIQLLSKKLEKYQFIGLTEEKNSLNPQFKPDTQMGKKKSKGSMESAFRWFKKNHQVHSELHDSDKKVYERRIQDMEDALCNRQNEITALKEKLAEAERVTHAVLRILKVDMTLEEKQQDLEDAHVNSNNRTVLQKDEEVEGMLTQLNNFMDERESWVAVISSKQAELAAAQVALEKLQECEMALVAENKRLKIENRMQVKKMGQLEEETKALSEQQTKHHDIKIKATGMLDNNNNDTGSPSVALEALKQMEAPLESTQLEHVKDFKLKKKIVEKSQRLCEMRSTHSSPISGIDSQSVISPR